MEAHDLEDNATGAGSAIVGVHKHKHNHRHVKRRDLAALEPRGTRTGHVCAGGALWGPIGRISSVMVSYSSDPASIPPVTSPPTAGDVSFLLNSLHQLSVHWCWT